MDNVANVDLHLLMAFDAMLRTRNVTLAAESVGLSQSTMSYSLTRLRKLLNDPLFVRTTTGMQPTPRAQQLAGPVREAIELINTRVLQRTSFDPATTTRAFRLCLSDVGEMVFLPPLLERLQTVAPNASVKAVHPKTKRVHQMLEHGDVDLAVGYFPELHAGVYQQTLFQHSQACIVRADHPTIRDELTLEQYLAANHAMVSGRGQDIVERALAQHGITRTVKLDVSHYMVIALIIQHTDMIVNVPHQLGVLFGKFLNTRMFPLPVETPTYDLKQHWHERFHHDPVNKWLRGQMADLFLGKPSWF